MPTTKLTDKAMLSITSVFNTGLPEDLIGHIMLDKVAKQADPSNCCWQRTQHRLAAIWTE